MWDKLNIGDVSQEEIDKIYNDICILAVLSGIEIDKAKRNYNVDTATELNFLSKKYSEEKPLFFKLIDEQKANKRIKSRKTTVEEEQAEVYDGKYRFYDSPMEHVYKVASSVDFRLGKEKNKKYIKIIDIIKKPVKPTASTAYKRSDAVMDSLESYKNELASLRAEQRLSDEEEREIIEKRIAEIKSIKREEISHICKDEADLYLVLKKFDKGDEKSWNVYEQVFGLELFDNMLANSKEKMKKVVESINGEYELYNKKYTKK